MLDQLGSFLLSDGQTFCILWHLFLIYCLVVRAVISDLRRLLRVVSQVPLWGSHLILFLPVNRACFVQALAKSLLNLHESLIDAIIIIGQWNCICLYTRLITVYWKLLRIDHDVRKVELWHLRMQHTSCTGSLKTGLVNGWRTDKDIWLDDGLAERFWAISFLRWCRILIPLLW